MRLKAMWCAGAVLVLAGLAMSAQVRAADDPNSWDMEAEYGEVKV